MSASMPPFDHHYYVVPGGGTAVISPGPSGASWMAAYFPPSPSGPSGYALDSGFPILGGPEAFADWLSVQPWTQPATAPEESMPPEAVPLDIPADEFRTLREKVKMDFGWRLAFSPEPDGSYSWAVLSDDGTSLQSGVASSWDDARLAVIADLYPPSSEGSSSR